MDPGFQIKEIFFLQRQEVDDMKEETNSNKC